MIDPVHPEQPPEEPKLRKGRITVTSEFELDPENYKGVEFPVESGEEKDLTDPEEMLAFERHQYLTHDTDVLEMLADADGEDVKFELVEEPTSNEPTGWVDEATGLVSGGFVTDD